ncbi:MULTISPECIES: response regulator [Pseudonocardia]|uniref:Transcriptional regulatory protein DegU n=2 Tax=Pseudonocardia TaxID=1847 RepID=A0A1Y2MUQ8_PSEAH|nr:MULTISPECIES: response regulator transcription factor [Pseudonocardia]OSY38905.1 Transcriptional regulatory protein DegU [Pseudonocardia autotrophica]TDN76161.1 LuxR family two component transcriptional regulator [Pseudonocardia autotrophica]BBG00142.1 DNA-binding response regulator [Pseudonocardia autotrophica]GEC26107.1 DNA-binding response regulator [Pseudonocardia saturnea]
MSDVRVLLADDQPLIRAGLRVLLETEPGYAVAGEAADGAEAIRLARAHRPDVVLMDVRMPGTDGLDALEAIAADPALTGTRVIVLTTFDLDAYVYRALRGGASGFLLKDTEPVALLRAIDLVHAGEALLAPSVTRRLITEFARRGPAAEPPGTDRLAVLTRREREVLTLVGAGRTNGEIAAELVISPATARTHVGRLLTKLDARDRVQLVVIAHEAGLVGRR